MNLKTSKMLRPRGHGWNMTEILLILVNFLVAVALLIFAFLDKNTNLHDGKQVTIIVVSFFANITNVMCFILIAKKKSSNYIGGIVAVILLGGVAFYYENTGTWIINGVFYIPTQTIGLIMGRKNSNKNKTSDIQSRTLKGGVILIICILSIAMTTVFTYINSLKPVQKFFYNSYFANPTGIHWMQFFCDAAVLVVSPVAMFLMMFRYRENLFFGIAVDVLLVLLGTLTLIVEKNTDAIQMVLSGGAVLLIVIYGEIYWRLDSKAHHNK